LRVKVMELHQAAMYRAEVASMDVKKTLLRAATKSTAIRAKIMPEMLWSMALMTMVLKAALAKMTRVTV
jgi:hypothetical protein